MRRLTILLALAALLAYPMIGLSTGTDTHKVKSVGVSVSDLSNPFFVRIADTVREQVALKLGPDVRVVVKSNAYDNERLKLQMQDFISEQVDLIILVASEPEAISPSIQQAQRTGIKVVAVDVDATGADATVTTDNIQAGEVACEHLAKHLSGVGQVVIINGPPVSSVLDRVAGCKSVLNNYPDIVLLSENLSGGGSVEGGMEAMARLMETYPDLDAVFAINDPTAAGALAIAEQSGNRNVVITSVDGAPVAVKTLSKGKGIWSATAAQFPTKMASRAVDIGIKLVAGESVTQRKIRIPTRLIFADNVGSYQGWD